MLLLLIGLSTASADDLEIEVPRDVTAVVLHCGGDPIRQEVPPPVGPSARVHFPMWPGRRCEVTLERAVGSLTQIGSWRCDDAGCVERTSEEAPAPPLAAGELRVLVTERVNNTALELTCPGGYRQRSVVADHSARFTGVPNEDCELWFKGGAPLRFRPVRPATWTCDVVSATAVCRTR